MLPVLGGISGSTRTTCMGRDSCGSTELAEVSFLVLVKAKECSLQYR